MPRSNPTTLFNKYTVKYLLMASLAKKPKIARSLVSTLRFRQLHLAPPFLLDDCRCALNIVSFFLKSLQSIFFSLISMPRDTSNIAIPVSKDAIITTNPPGQTNHDTISYLPSMRQKSVRQHTHILESVIYARGFAESTVTRRLVCA